MSHKRERHLDYVYRILRDLQKKLGKNPGRMAYDPMYETTDEYIFEVVERYLYEWKHFYPDAQEMIPRHIVVVCSWSPGRKACPNYQAVEFQPRTEAIQP